jgi:DNA polymerase III epsilon subunit-like protein
MKNGGKMKKGPTFVAIDFETADYKPDSACAVGLVRVENHQIVERAYTLIRPPRKKFVFTYYHGISWEMWQAKVCLPIFGPDSVTC